MRIFKLMWVLAWLTSCVSSFAEGNSGTFTNKRQITSMTAVCAGMTLSEMGSAVVVFTDGTTSKISQACKASRACPVA